MTREEAIQAIKEKMDYYESDKRLRGAIETLIPELTESEDERIIRAIIDALYSHTNSINLLSSRGYQMGDIEAWLEKQKECLADNNKTSTDEDERIRKELVNFLQSPFINENLTDEKVAPWIAYLEKQKEPENTSASTMAPSCWEVEQKEQKPAWSEEDEQLLGFIYDLLADSLWNSRYAMSRGECLDRLTSLRQRLQPRPSWKPSEEQMGALWKIMKYAVSLSSYYNIQKEIESLYNDLNKLK